jgi:transposase
MPRTRPPYPEQFRREAVELVRKARGDRSVTEIAKDLGVTEQSLRNWVKQADVDAGRAHGVSSEEKEELRRLRRENRILCEEREILVKAGSPGMIVGEVTRTLVRVGVSVRPVHRRGE